MKKQIIITYAQEEALIIAQGAVVAIGAFIAQEGSVPGTETKDQLVMLCHLVRDLLGQVEKAAA